MKKYKILFKYPSRGNGFKFVSAIHNIISKVSDKENFIILVSADRDDAMMLNKEIISSIQSYIDSGKLVICFDKSASKIDAINRDMEMITDWDIAVSVSDDTEFTAQGFDESIRAQFINNFPDTDGKMYFDSGIKDVLVMGKSHYDRSGYIYNPNKKYNLFVNYYTDKNDERTKELNFCMLQNLRNESIDNIVVISNEIDYLKLKHLYDGDLSKKITPMITDLRPSFNDYFKLTSKLFNGEDNVNIISNLDIIIPLETIIKSKEYLNTNKTCLALTRWDIKDMHNMNSSVFFDRPDSQDAWFFVGGVPKIAGADYSLGIAGIDNSIAHQLEQSGYNVINPSRTLKTFHFHLTEVRNYTNIVGQDIFRIPPPYKLLPPTD